MLENSLQLSKEELSLKKIGNAGEGRNGWAFVTLGDKLCEVLGRDGLTPWSKSDPQGGAILGDMLQMRRWPILAQKNG